MWPRFEANAEIILQGTNARQKGNVLQWSRAQASAEVTGLLSTITCVCWLQ
jgi:hypothetical protein